jgi:hypothetical protein
MSLSLAKLLENANVIAYNRTLPGLAPRKLSLATLCQARYNPVDFHP